MKILIANIGSTSFKYRLVELDRDLELAGGRVERIGQPGGAFPDYESAIAHCLETIVGEGRALGALTDLAAVGFKAVHGGPLSGARLVDEAVLEALDRYAFFAPAHNPPYARAMRAFRVAAAELPLVAVFETAFFEHLDEATTSYAVPHDWRQAHGIRRYGFHGASHRAASEQAQALLGKADLRHISCHLGGSSSLAAIRGGRAIDTSFGVSPQSGLPQNNRVGDLDVFGALYVMQQRRLSVDEMAQILARESGLAGLSGGSGDVRDLLSGAQAGEPRAKVALDVFVRSVRHYLGAFLVELGGLDVLSFSGGIGENSPEIRAAVCDGLSELGIALDASKNAANTGLGPISPDTSPVAVVVVPADEERVVARETGRVVAALG